jgi:hypothetical protein
LIERYTDTFCAGLIDMTDTAAICEVVERSFTQLGYIIVIIINDALSSAMSRPSSATRVTTM